MNPPVQPSAQTARPSFDDFVAYIREFEGISTWKRIERNTFLEDDLGITGDDGWDLLLNDQSHFGVALYVDEASFDAVFGLAPNEYLFVPEGGFGDFPITLFTARSLKPLTVGALYEAVCSKMPPPDPS